jgi:type 2 lantibiotic biosynthesis protein LanM
MRTKNQNKSSGKEQRAFKIKRLKLEFMAAAREIAEQTCRDAVRGAYGTANWMTLERRGDKARLKPMGHDLYAGRCGVAVFLAALYYLTGTENCRDFAASALYPLARILDNHSQRRAFGRRVALGAGSGIGGMIWALVRSAGFLDDSRYLDHALRLGKMISREKIEQDGSLDVLDGAAGAILGLLALEQASGGAAPLTRAVECGDHLLRKASQDSAGRAAWPSKMAACPFTGFAHGAAGIAFALLRLFARTGQDRFRATGERALAYVSSVFCPEVGNWAVSGRSDAGGERAPKFWTTWCHGAPGIGLARLGSLAIQPQCKRDVETALQTTLRRSLRGPDNLCCGNMGRIEFLSVAARQLQRPSLCDAAIGKASRVGHRMRPTASKAWTNPALFQGTAGIGYQLLRLVEPRNIPSVLLWE